MLRTLLTQSTADPSPLPARCCRLGPRGNPESSKELWESFLRLLRASGSTGGGVARFLEPRPLRLAYGLALEAVCPLGPPVPSFDWFMGPSVVSGGGCILAEKGRSSRRKSAAASARCLSRRRGLLVGGRLYVQRHRPGGVGGGVLGRATTVREIVDLAWGASRANFTLWGPAQGSRPRGWGPSLGWV